MTRDEHLDWCKKRAKEEFDYYFTKEGLEQAIINGLASMMSDLNKHDETRSETLQHLCLIQMLIIKNKYEFVTFINGFN